jgi:ligand-binding sensor domain-containing protein/two-component sensor histidine kinase
MMQKLVTILFVFLCQSTIAQPQFPAFSFEKYSTANGLTDNGGHALLQDSRGFLWISGSNGLNRFDGKSFKQYNSFGKNGLTDISTTCIAEDGEGNIWIGTGNGLNKLDPFTETITHYYEGSGPGTIPYRWCNYLYSDKNKNLWLATEKGIALFNSKTNSFQNFQVLAYGPDAKINKFINQILEDSKGRFWLATSYGVKLFDRVTKTYASFHFEEPPGQQLKENVVISLFEDHNGMIWAGTWGGGLLQYDASKNIFKKVTLENYALPVGQTVTCMAEANTGNTIYLLLTISNHLYFLQQQNGKNYLWPVQLQPQDQTAYAAADNNFMSIYTDRQKNIWVSSTNGLYKMQAESNALQSIKVGNDKSLSIFHVIPDIKMPQDIFYLSSTSGWWKYNAANRLVSVYQLPVNGVQLLQFINAWSSDDKGYWFSSMKGFGYYDIYNNRVTDLSAIIKERSGQEGTGYIARDGAGKIWLSMWRSGLLFYDPAEKKYETLLADSSKPGNILGRSCSDLQYYDGNIYCCVNYKLYKINTTTHSYTIISPPVYEEQVDEGKIAPAKMLVTKDNRIFFSSKLRIYELKNASLVNIFPATGPGNFFIDDLSADDAGNIWASTSKGFFKTGVSFKQWISIPGAAAWTKEDFSEINTNRPGEIIFNGKGSIGVLKDSLLPITTAPPMVIISSVKYGDKQNYLLSLRPVTIRSSYKDAVEIELSAIDFAKANDNKILYQLEGWDDNWKELAATTIRYEQLPPGGYVFKTKTLNTAGMESAATIMNFVIVPPFYRTWWFISLAVLLIATILFLFYRYRLQKALEMEKLRTRIATDLHDDIGATLSSISMYSDAVKHEIKEKLPHLEPVLNKMGENSRDMVNSMSDIVWAINPDNDEGSKLVQRMENHARDICAAKNIRLQFEAGEKVRSIQLPLEHRKNIYLVFKESLNNALKYAAANSISIFIDIVDNKINLTIADDGKGFNAATVKNGNGLKNLYARAAEIRGEIKIITAENKGTIITLTCSFN